MVENVRQMIFLPDAENWKELLLQFPFVGVCLAVEFKFVCTREAIYITSSRREVTATTAVCWYYCSIPGTKDLEADAGPVPLD